MASIMMSSSIRLSLTGLQVDWMTNTSHPRTVSLMETETSPSAKLVTGDTTLSLEILSQGTVFMVR